MKKNCNKTSMACNRCGYCCTSAFFAMVNVDLKDEKEVGKWFDYHRCETMKYPTPNGDVLGVKVPISCKHLDYNAEEGYFCKIYDQRPIVCKEYFCKTVTEKFVKALALKSIVGKE